MIRQSFASFAGARPRSALLIMLAATTSIVACDQRELPFEPSPNEPGITVSPGAAHVSGSERGPWSEPVNLTVLNSTAQDNQPTLSPDELSLYFASQRTGGLGMNDVWVSRRESLESPWQTPGNVGVLNTAANDNSPAFSRDGLLLFFQSNRPGGQGEVDIYVARRNHKHDDFDWGPAVNLGTDVNTSVFEAGPVYLQQVEDGPVNLYFGRGLDAVGIDMYSVPIKRGGETRGPASPVTELNFSIVGVTDAHPTVSRDGKEVIFFSSRPGGFGTEDLYVSTRQSVHSPWSEPVNLGPVLNTTSRDAQPSLSFDGGTLLFSSNRPGGLGGTDIYMSTRTRNAQ
jgi:hypothetical protein